MRSGKPGGWHAFIFLPDFRDSPPGYRKCFPKAVHRAHVNLLICETLRRGLARGGSTIVEIMVAMSVVVLFFSGIFLMNSQVLGLLRSTLESTGSLRTLNGRAEQLRSSTWTQLTAAAYLADTILATAPDSGGDLGLLTETIDVTAAQLAPMQVRRNPDGTRTVVAAGDPALPAQASVRIDVTASWVAKGGRTRVRQMSMIFGRGGISGRN